jgi:hypothetical protein
MALIDTFWPRPKPKPVPQPDPTPDNTVSPAKWLQAWALFRKIPVQELLPVFTLVPVLVFFAVSGLLAWTVVLLAFMARLLKVLV